MNKKTASFALVFALWICMLGFSIPQNATAKPLAAVTIHHVYITDTAKEGFTVSWTTSGDACTGTVYYGVGDPPVLSSQTDTYSGDVHLISLSGLTQDTDYQYYVECGSERKPAVGYYTTKTGTYDLAFVGIIPNPVSGILTYDPGTGAVPVENAIVYLQIQDPLGGANHSQWVSFRTNDTGFWGGLLENTLNASATDQFAYAAGDDMRIVWQAGGLGTMGDDDAPLTFEITASTSGQTIDMLIQNLPNAVRIERLSAKASPMGGQFGRLFAAASIAVGVIIVRAKRKAQKAR